MGSNQNASQQIGSQKKVRRDVRNCYLSYFSNELDNVSWPKYWLKIIISSAE